MRYLYLCCTLALLCSACSPLGVLTELKSTQITARKGFLKDAEMDVVIFDSRPSKKYPRDIKEVLLAHLADTYPDLKLYQLEESAFFEVPEKDRLTLKISLIRYSREDVDFSSADDDASCSVDPTFVVLGRQDQSVAKTVLEATLYDYRSGKRKFNHRISERAYSSRVINGAIYSPLRLSFQRAMDQLCSFIDHQLLRD